MDSITNRKLKRITLVLSYSLLLMLFFASTSHAGWEVYKRATLKNDRNNNLIFDSYHGEYIRIWLRLKKYDKGTFSKKLPVYRVDSNDINQIEKDKNYKDLKFKSGIYISWIISNSEIPSKELREFMNGKEVVFQYYRDDGKIMEAVFPLGGIKEAIGKIL